MSRIGKLPVQIVKDVKVTLTGQKLTVEGPKGKLEREFHPDMNITVDEKEVTVTRPSDKGFHRALHGMTRALIQNMVTGVSQGYKKELEMIGVGYRGEMKGRYLMLYVGYSHPVLVKQPDGVEIQFDHKASLITVTGIDKELVGLTADRIRSIRKPEPYKGKGIRYKGEYVRKKAGKTAA